MDRTKQTKEGLVELVRMALDASTGLDELVDCAHAAAGVGDAGLAAAVAARIGDEVDRALVSASAWESELTYNKVEGWAQTGRRARLLAEAWGAIQGVVPAKVRST